jgi:hypothetical protein
VTNRIRLRSKAALYNGNSRGPNASVKSGSERAGWNGSRAGLGISNAVASLRARFRWGMLGRRSVCGFCRRVGGELDGEMDGDSRTTEDSFVMMLYRSQ